MGFPWEVDEQPEVKKQHSKRGYQKRIAGNASKRSKVYQTSGHPKWYFAYLKTPHWAEFKKKWRASSTTRRCCMICYNVHYELHHWTYERIGAEELTDVVPLCRAHHLKAHKLESDGTPLAEAHLKLLR